MKKEEAYKWSIKQIRSKIKKRVDIVSTLGNCAAILKERLPHYFWVGFYHLKDNHLILGPFQGPPACVKLSLDKGVCAETVKRRETVLVENVEEFPGHVGCDSRSKSEIVVPLFNSEDTLVAVLDADSESLGDFDETDKKYLEEIAAYLKEIWNKPSMETDICKGK